MAGPGADGPESTATSSVETDSSAADTQSGTTAPTETSTVDGETLCVYTVSDPEQLYLPTDQADTSESDEAGA